MPETDRAAELAPSSMSTDALRDAINQAGLSPEDQPQPESEAIEPEETAEPQDEPEGETEESEPEAAAPDGDQGETADPPDELEALRSQLEAERAERRHQEVIAGRHAGKLGYVEQQTREARERIALLEQMIERMGRGGEDGEATEPILRQPRRSATEATPLRDPSLDYLAALAVKNALDSVAAGNKSIRKDDGEFTDEFKQATTARQEELARIAAAGNPMYVQQASAQLFREIVSGIERDQARARSDEIMRRRADQSNGIKDKKKAMAATAGGGGRSGPRPRQPTRVSEIPTKDLRKLIDSRVGLED